MKSGWWWVLAVSGSAKTTALAEDGSDVWDGRTGEANEAIGQVKSSLWASQMAVLRSFVQDSRCDDRTGQILQSGCMKRRTRPDVLSPVNGERYSGSCWGRKCREAVRARAVRPVGELGWAERVERVGVYA